MFNNRRIDEQIVVYSHNIILYIITSKQTTDISNNIAESF